MARQIRSDQSKARCSCCLRRVAANDTVAAARCVERRWSSRESVRWRRDSVRLLAAAKAGLPVAEYTATAVKRAVVGYGRADKEQVQRMVTLLLGLEKAPSPHDVSDALAIAICHAHSGALPVSVGRSSSPGVRSWRRFRPPVDG